MGEACPIRIRRPRTAVNADMATGRQGHAAIERTTPGGGIIPSGPSQADNPLFRLASKVTAHLGHLPAPLRNRVLLVLQRSTRPSKKAAGGIPVTKTSPGGVPTTWLAHDQHRRGTVVFLHGGAYTGGPFAGQWKWLAELHRTAGVAAAMVLYRMPPRHPHPAALDDTIRAITALHASGELEEGRWILAGDSAGGGLALAAAQALRDSGGPMPAGLVLTAPWVDLEMATPQIEAAEKADPFLSRSGLWWSARVYADGAALDDPRLSPINASMTGLPPVHLNVGTRDLFLPDVRRLRDALHDARVPVTHIEQEGAVHAYPQQITTPEAQWTIRDQIRWLRNVLQINESAPTSASRSAPPAAPWN